jgi:hypothetical protein
MKSSASGSNKGRLRWEPHSAISKLKRKKSKPDVALLEEELSTTEVRGEGGPGGRTGIGIGA